MNEDIFTIRKPKAPTDLTPREAEVLGLMAEGWNNQAIADKLCIGVKTVEHYLVVIFSKIRVNNDTIGRNMRVFTAVLYLLAQDKLK